MKAFSFQMFGRLSLGLQKYQCVNYFNLKFKLKLYN